MSITFTCPEAPRHEVECPFCVEARERGWVESHENCDPYCSGTSRESEAPEVNFANGNAMDLCRLLNLSTECWGEVSAEELPALQRRLIQALNVDSHRSHLVIDGYELEPGHAGTAIVHEDGLARIERRGPRVVSFGNTDDQTIRRLSALQTLVTFATENNFPITWG